MTRLLKLQPLLIALTLINLALLVTLLAQARAAGAPAPSSDIIRGKGLEIVDSAGKVRASISVLPAENLRDGSTYPETVLLRLITSEGRPVVKIGSSEDGGGMALSTGRGLAYAQLLARGDDPKLVIVDKNGKQQSTVP